VVDVRIIDGFVNGVAKSFAGISVSATHQSGSAGIMPRPPAPGATIIIPQILDSWWHVRPGSSEESYELITITTFCHVRRGGSVLHGSLGSAGDRQGAADHDAASLAAQAIVTFVVSSLILPGFDSSQAGPQMTKKVLWIGAWR
jgi:hypothetical protein